MIHNRKETSEELDYMYETKFRNRLRSSSSSEIEDDINVDGS